MHQNSREHSTDLTINRICGGLARVTLPSAILCRFLLDSLPFSFLLQNWLPWRTYISMKLQVFIPVSFEQSFSEKTSFPENEFLCWATGEGGRQKLHGTTENLPSSKQSSESRISENIYVLKTRNVRFRFSTKHPALSKNSQQSKQIVCHDLQIAVATPLYPGTLAAPHSQASEIPHPSKAFQNRTAMSYLSTVTEHSTASR